MGILDRSARLLRRVAWVLVVALLFAMLAAVTRVPAHAAGLPPNPVAAENAQPGSSNWHIVNATDDVAKQIKGYASATSVNLGDPLTFYVTENPATTFNIDIYRMGYYQGLGGRLMQHVADLPGVSQPDCPQDPATGLTACNWSPSYTFNVPTDWTSGVFLARLDGNGYQSYIIFTLRDDARQSALLYQQSVSTYQAYNNYPNDVPVGSSVPDTGKSLYDYNSSTSLTGLGTKRAAKVSYDRPYSNDDGAGDFLDWEMYYIRWMEQSGYDVTYSTDIDTATNGQRLANHRGFLSVGHDEYWTKSMRDAVTAARNAGTNIGFFGANEMYWQIRLEPSSSGTPNRVQVCYKSATNDPTTDSSLTTVQWRQAPLNQPEQSVVGVMSTGQQPSGASPAPYVVNNSGNWVYDGTGVQDGVAIPGIVGYETDRQVSTNPLPSSVPGTYTLLSNSPLTTASGGTDHAQASIYEAGSGAWVFGAGSIEWAWGLSDTGHSTADPRIQQMTANILNRFVLPPSPPPAAPSALTATPSASGTVSLGWTDNSADENSFAIERSSSSTFASSTTMTVPANTTSYVDNPGPPGVYYYRVHAVGSSGQSTNTATIGASTTPYASLVANRPGLLSYWRLGEAAGGTAFDVTGARNGSYATTVALGAPGVIANDSDTAARFDGGVATRVNLPGLPTVTDFSVEGWSYLTNASGLNNTVFAQQGNVRLLARPGGSASPTTGYGSVWLNGTEYAVQPNANGVSNVNTWVHWVLTRQGSALSLYRNGVLVGSRNDLPATASATISGAIGSAPNSSYPLSGSIDDVAVYSGALSAGQVTDDYTAALNGTAPSPASHPSYASVVRGEPALTNYWRLGETSGPTATDEKGGKNGSYAAAVSLGKPGAIANDPNTAAAFDGAPTTRVNLPALPTVTDFSVEGWSYLTNATAQNDTVFAQQGNVRLLARPGGSASPTTGYGSVWLNGTEYALQPNANGVSNVNTWVHWVLTRQGSALSLYRNGVLVGSRNDLPATASATISGAIGGAPNGSYPLTGSIDEVAVYNAALSSSAVSSHYLAGLQGGSP